jgi:hypothetical protein
MADDDLKAEPPIDNEPAEGSEAMMTLANDCWHEDKHHPTYVASCRTDLFSHHAKFADVFGFDPYGDINKVIKWCRLAEKEIARLVYFHYPRFNTETLLQDDGYYMYPARKRDEAVRFFAEHDAELGQVSGDEIHSFGYIRGVPYFGRKATEKEREKARERIEKRNKYREGLRIVALEARDR